MAIIGIASFEPGFTFATNGLSYADNISYSNTGPFNTVSRTGSNSGKINGPTNGYFVISGGSGGPGTDSHSIGFWIYITAYPASGLSTICKPQTQTEFFIKINSSGAVGLYDGSDIQYSNTTTEIIPINTWTYIRIYTTSIAPTSLISKVFIDGKSLGSASKSFTSSYNVTFGDSSGNRAFVAYIDDYIMATSSEAPEVNRYNRVYYFVPTSDVQRGSWTGGAGGTTNLYDAINNDPPIGTATETNLTQIESADSSGDNSTDEYRIGFPTYNSKISLASGETLRKLVYVVNIIHGEDVATGTKQINVALQSNPALTISSPWDVAPTSGALGTYPTGWFSKSIASADVASSDVTLSSSPVVSLRKTDTGTRVASVCYVGLYVLAMIERFPNITLRTFPHSILHY